LLALQIAGLARHADLVLGALVEGLELGVAHGPIDDGGILRNGGGAVALDGVRAHPEVIFVKAPGDGTVVDGATARLIAVALGRDRSGPRARIGAPGDRLTLGIRAQVLALEVAQLVLRREVLGAQARAALEPDHLHAGLTELGRENAAGSADAD